MGPIFEPWRQDRIEDKPNIPQAVAFFLEGRKSHSKLKPWHTVRRPVTQEDSGGSKSLKGVTVWHGVTLP